MSRKTRSPAPPGDPQLALRVRALVAGRASERRMFGCDAFFVGGHMALGIYGSDLVLRLGADAAAALDAPGAMPFAPAGRAMKGWVQVHGAALHDEALEHWVEPALAQAAALPPK